MALRAKVRELPAGMVPVELLSKEHPVWESERATRRWLTAQGLEWVDRMAAGPLNRHEWAAHQWARANGFTRELPSGYLNIDWRRLFDAGVGPWGGAEMSEWLAHIGVEGRR